MLRSETSTMLSTFTSFAFICFISRTKGMFCVHIHVHWEPTIGAFAPTGTCLLLYQAKLNPRVNHGQMEMPMTMTFHEKILRVDDGYCYTAMSIAPAIACIIARPIFGLAVPSFVEQR